MDHTIFHRGLTVLEREARMQANTGLQLVATMLNQAIERAGPDGLSDAQRQTVESAAARF